MEVLVERLVGSEPCQLVGALDAVGVTALAAMRAATQATQTSARPLAPATICLAAAAAVTERIGLLTNIFIAPVRPPTVFAKRWRR